MLHGKQQAAQANGNGSYHNEPRKPLSSNDDFDSEAKRQGEGEEHDSAFINAYSTPLDIDAIPEDKRRQAQAIADEIEGKTRGGSSGKGKGYNYKGKDDYGKGKGKDFGDYGKGKDFGGKGKEKGKDFGDYGK